MLTSASMNTTTNTTTIESDVHHLPRVPSSPVISSETATPPQTQSSDLILEDEDAFATSASSLRSLARPPIMTSYYQRPTRRERSLSSITSPRNPHQRSSSAAILDLEYSSPDSALATKRRSLSTCGPSAMPPPATLEVGGHESWSPPEKLCKPPPKSRTMPPSHVRFEDKPYKCHHLLSEESHWTQQTQQAVQRTQSNPEMMELCPVCLARKECEILLKRTYSKV